MVDWGGDDNYSAEWQKALEKVDFQAGQITALRQEIAAARRAAFEECERIARDLATWNCTCSACLRTLRIADAIAKRKDAP